MIILHFGPPVNQFTRICGISLHIFEKIMAQLLDKIAYFVIMEIISHGGLFMGIARQLSRIKFLPFAATRLYCCEFLNKVIYHNKNEKRITKNWFAYQKYRTAVMKKLRRKFTKPASISAKKILQESENLTHCNNRDVWIYWAQGFENAPDLIKLCAQSTAHFLGGGSGYNIHFLSDDNLDDYVTFPNFILEKYHKGSITKTLFSDLLRLELLIKYGGLWLDATVLCSGAPIPAYMFHEDLFLFQTTPFENRIVPTRIESFFISAKSNHPMLILCRELLYSYLKKNEYIADYFIIYEIFELVIEAMPKEWEKVIYYPRTDIFTLADEVYKPYNEKLIKILLERFPFHKLSYKEPRAKNSGLDFLITHPEFVTKSH